MPLQGRIGTNLQTESSIGCVFQIQIGRFERWKDFGGIQSLIRP